MSLARCFGVVKQIVKYLEWMVLIFICWCLLVWLLCPDCIDQIPEPTPIGLPIISFRAMLVLVLMAPLEELFFRFLPLLWIRVNRRPLCAIIMIVIASSVVFGYLHGNSYNILFQGVLGILLCVIYLKAGGYEGKHVQALFMSSVVHFTYNVIVCISALFNGGTVI